MLTYEKVREFFDYNPETGVLTWRKSKGSTARAGNEVGSHNPEGYMKTIFDGKHYPVHRIIWLWVYGDWPKYQINHINVVPDDNRLCNLEDVPLRENCRKKKCHKEGKLAGVRKSKKAGRFFARIVINKKKVTLGTFDSEEEAYSAYLNACREIEEGVPITTYRNTKITRGTTYNKSKQGWFAQVTISKRRRICLGPFLTELEAHEAYLSAKAEALKD